MIVIAIFLAIYPWAIAQGGDSEIAIEEELEPAPSSQPASQLPTFISLAANINDFGRFADGGSDANWYVGFNNAWIVKLPPAPEGEFARAFVGAKLGRAKTVPRSDRPWELAVIPGKVYAGLSQRPAFGSEHSFMLTETKDIPLEPHEETYMAGAGRSEWFWTEVPLALVSRSRPNYLIVWSPTRELRDAAHSPILAAMEAGPGEHGEPAAWNNHGIQGVPPRSEQGALQVPITNIRPALAIKLVPAAGGRVTVADLSVQLGAEDILVEFSVLGTDVELAWVESSTDELEWKRVSRLRRAPPYAFTLPRGVIGPRGGYLRAAARNLLAVEGYTKSAYVPPAQAASSSSDDGGLR